LSVKIKGMQISVVKETGEYEKRVAATPDSVKRLIKAGFGVTLEKGAGLDSGYYDSEYLAAGAQIANDSATALKGADIVFKIQAPDPAEIKLYPENVFVIGLLTLSSRPESIRAFCEQKANVYALEYLPRISRAQSMDVLSSQATVSGYVAMLTAALALPKFFPMFMTAAGTVAPAKVFVIGAGVAGLQAIATAKRLGANVRAYDVRQAAAEEVASLGATFVKFDLESQEGQGGYAKEQSEEFIKKQRQLMSEQIVMSDVVVSTAAIPGKTAPRIITKDMVEKMQPSSVIFDLAAETGGNCELSKPGETVIVNGVKIIGARNVPSLLSYHASFLNSRNLFEFVNAFSKDGEFRPDENDEIIKGVLAIKNGEILNPLLKEAAK
jgi:NAD(P) transhydrogenase subunit alpha